MSPSNTKLFYSGRAPIHAIVMRMVLVIIPMLLYSLESSSASNIATGGAVSNTLAFPHATGFGRFAKGGRGGNVLIVNTLEDVVDPHDNLISIREAIEVETGPRTVVFQVGGVFDLDNTELSVVGEENSFLTVACQTAPNPGVIIKSAGIRIKGGAHDIIIRHCRIRNIDPGQPLSESSRAIGVVGTRNGVTNMIFDHLSLSWATDENYTVFTGPETNKKTANITLSNSIIAEGDADSSHSESGQLPERYVHSMGPSCNSASPEFEIEGCSILGNFIAHNARRNPLIVGSSGEIQNNIIYNWHETAIHAWTNNHSVSLYIANNELKRGPNSKRKNHPIPIHDETKQINITAIDNTLRTWRAIELDEQKMEPLIQSNHSDPINLDCVGASKPSRDKIDTRIINEYLESSGQVGIGNNHIRDYSGYEESRHPQNYDTDQDGMADAWERDHNLDPANPLDYNVISDGEEYTALEKFINFAAFCEGSKLTEQREKLNNANIVYRAIRHLF